MKTVTKWASVAASAAVLAAAAFAPGFAQESAAPEAAGATTGPEAVIRSKPASIRLDFGAGRKVHVDCGTADISACVAAVTPLADKVAATPVAPGPRMEGHGKGWHERGGDKPGKERREREGRADPKADPKAEPPKE